MWIIEAFNQEYPIPVTLGFNQNLRVGKVSSAKLVNGAIIADIEIDDVPEVHALKTEIGGIIKRSHNENGIRVIDEFDLREISIGFSRNVQERENL